MFIPLFAHTAQALGTGRYPLQSGLRTQDSNYQIPYIKKEHSVKIAPFLCIVLKA